MYRAKRYSKRAIAVFLSLMIVISAISSLFTGFVSAAISSDDVTILNSTDGLTAENSVIDASGTEIGFQKTPAEGVMNINSHNAANLTDGNFESQAEFYWSEAPFFDVKEGNDLSGNPYTSKTQEYAAIGTQYLDGSERFLQVTVPLKGVTDISNIVVVNHSSQNLTTYYYEVFASNSEATLFDASNSVYKYTNTDKKQVQNYKIADGALTDMTYIGLRVYNPCYTENGKWAESYITDGNGVEIYYSRLFEFNAYGTVTSPIDETFTVTTNDETSIPANLGDKAYNDVNAKFYSSTGANTASFTMSQLANMLDENTSTERQFMATDNNAAFTQNGGEYMNFDFEIKDNFIIRKLLVVNHTDVNLATKRYDILVADTREGLDTATPLQAYDNASGDATQLFTVKSADGLKAKFLRVKVLLPFDWAKFNANGYSASFAVCRFLEMGVYGEYDASAKYQYNISQSNVGASNLTYPTGTNITKDITPTVEYYNSVTGASASGFGTPSKLSDADYSTDYHTGDRAPHTYMDGSTLKWYTKEDGVYTQITYNLGTVDTITDIVVNNHDTPAIRMGSYEIYVSETLADLDKTESLVGTISTGGNRQQTIHFTNEVKGQYVRLRTYDVCYDHSWSSASATSVYLRLCDFVAYGTKGTQSSNEKVSLKTENNDATNPVTGKTSVVKAAKFTGKGWEDTTPINAVPRVGGSNAPSAFEALTDGTVNNEVEIDIRFAEGTEKSGDTAGTLIKINNDGVTAYADILYTLDGFADISDIVVMGHQQPDIWAISYDLYAGNSVNTIFDSEPIYSFKNTSGTRTQHFKVNDLKAGYLAMRITAACTTTELSDYLSYAQSMGASIIHPRIYEFNVYGTAGEPLDTVNFSEGNLSLPTGNSIVYRTAVKYFDGTDETGIDLSTIGNLADGNIANEFLGSPTITPFAEANSNPIKLYTDRYVKITHTLYDNAEISDIFVYNHSTTDLRTYKYKLYASDSESTLWDEANLIYDFTNSSASRAQLYSTNKTAKYVGMIITDPCTQPFASDRTASQIYPRLWEFNVFGTGTEPSGDPEEAPTEGVTDYQDTTMPAAGTNFLKGMMVSTSSIYSKVLNKSGNIGGASMYGNLTDENVGTEWFTGTIQSDVSFAGWDSENNKPVLNVNGDVYVDLTYNLGGTATVEKMYFGHHNTPARRMGKWEIYMNDNDDEDLFTAENLVKTVTNPKAARGQLVTFDAPIVGVRNIGIRIINPVTDEAYALNEITATNYNTTCPVYPRINEIAAYGSFEADPFVFQRVINNSSHALPNGVDLSGLTNLSTPLSPFMSGTDTLTNEVKKTSSSGSAKMKDGDFATECEIPSYHFAEWMGDKAAYYIKGERYLDVYYDLGSEADVEYIVIGNHTTSELVTGKYDVYIGNSKTDLYNKGNLYASVDNIKTYNKGGSNQVNVIAFDQAQTGVSSKVRYVGIRIYTPVCATEVTDTVTVTETRNNIYPRIREFSVYGTYTDPNYVPGSKKFQDTLGMNFATIFANGDNLLTYDNVDYMMDGKKIKLTSSTATNAYNFWHDNSGAIHYDFSEMNGKNPTFIFKLDKYDMTQISGFAYQGIAQDNEAYYASHIKVHVAEEREDVTLDSSVVAEYYLEDDGVNRGIYYKFPEGSEPQGCFMAFEFVNPVNTAEQHVYPRISLLYAWGKQAVIRAVPANIAENMPIDIYFNNGGELTKVSESNLTAAEAKKLTDGDKTTTAKINTKGSDRDTMEIIYNLCGDIDIDKIALTALIDGNTGFKTMKVYAANAIAKVNDESSLIWTYKVGSKTGTINPSKSFSTSQNMRYLRFVFEGTKDYLVFGEIEAIGMDNQKMKTRTLTSTLTYEDITFTLSDIETGKQTYISANNSFLEGLIDADEGTAFTFYDGVVGKDKYDITLYLGDLRTVSNITNNFFKHFMEYTPGSINVYISETIAGITDENAEPVYVINRKDIKDGVYSKQLRPMLARYVRFEIMDFPEIKHFTNPDGTPRITAIIGDIKVVGTKVKGLQTSEEDETLLTFHDEETDIDVSILRLNNEINDIFTDAVSVRVTAEKATNWQMRSLQENGSLKVIDKKIYKIEFLDLYGNVVKDLGERDISVSFKTPKGFSGNSSMVGDASLRTKITGLDTYQAGGRTSATMKWDPEIDTKVALLGMIPTDDPYWDTIGELENFEEGNEDDLKGDSDAEIHDATWYDSIHTEDGVFTVTPVNFQFEDGLKFEAKDISATAPEERYEAVLSQADGKKVAIYYDMKLTLGDDEFDVGGQWVEITMDAAELLSSYSDLEVFHVDDMGIATKLWCMTEGNYFIFQTDSFSDFVLVGTALDGSSSIGDGTENGFSEDGTSPSTGEDTRALYVALLFMVAAGYVAIRFGKKSANKQ